jgi:CHAT domain-containing protein/Tfp pilus assembly protein PilF
LIMEKLVMNSAIQRHFFDTLLGVAISAHFLFCGVAIAQQLPDNDQAFAAAIARVKSDIDIAGKLFDKGKFEDVLNLIEKTCADVSRVLPAEHPSMLRCLNSLAGAYRANRRIQEANSLYEKVLAMAENTLKSDDPDLAIYLNSVAVAESNAGNWDRAEALYKRAIGIREKADPDGPDLANSLSNLGVLYQRRNDFDRALPLFERALNIRERKLPGDDPAMATALNTVATLLRIKGDLPRAKQLQTKALEIREKANGREHPLYAQALNELALIHIAEEDILKAESVLRKAISIHENLKIPNPESLAPILENLGMLVFATGNTGEAETLVSRSLEIRERPGSRSRPDQLGFTSTNLGLILMEKRDYAKAETYLLRGLSLRQGVLQTNSAPVVQSLMALGLLYWNKEDYEKSQTFYEQALTASEGNVWVSRLFKAGILANLGQLHTSKLQFDRAEDSFKQAQQIYEDIIGERGAAAASLYSRMAVLFEAEGKIDKAKEFLSKTAQLQERDITIMLAGGSQEQKRLFMERLSSETNLIVSLHTIAAPSDPEALNLAFTTVIRRKGRSLDAMSDVIQSLRRALSKEDIKLLNEWAGAQARLGSAITSAAKSLSSEKVVAAATEISREIDAHERKISERAREQPNLARQISNVSLDDVRRELPGDSALVEFMLYSPHPSDATGVTQFWSPHRYVAYVLRKEGEPKWTDLGPATEIDHLILKFKTALGTRQSTRKQYGELARGLDEKLMRPVRRLIGNVRTIFVAPDWQLNLIPFGALVDERGTYLIENYSITYLTSGRDLLRLQTGGKSREPLHVFTNPLYDLTMDRGLSAIGTAKRGPTDSSKANSQRSKDFAQQTYPLLPGTAAEGDAIKRLFPEAIVEIQENATEAALKKANSPRALHIATHGFFLANQSELDEADHKVLRGTFDSLASQPPIGDWENPLLRSGLVLAGVKQGQSGPGEDGVLTALEAAALNLFGTKLVVLSACETGLGDVRNGEGVYGLRRALVLAGSETQVMSLWKVSDGGTRDLMIAYYTRLRNREGRAEALRQVQLRMLRGKLTPGGGGDRRGTSDTDEKFATKDYRHPYYWAAFIPSGDWRNLEGK